MSEETKIVSPNDEKASDKLFINLSLVVAVALCIFHLLAASPLLTLNNTEQAVVHGVLIVTYFLLVNSFKFPGGKLIDIAMIVITVLCAIEALRIRNSNSAVFYSQYQQIICILFVIVSLIVGYRALGKILPTVCIIFLLYTFLGRYLPGMWATARVTVTRMCTYLVSGSEGLFGSALSTAATYIFLFVMFGAALNFIGAGEFFVKIAFAAFGRVCGGPAQASIYSSMLMGMVNGSGAANVVTTGVFTIPLMKQTGFDANTAGAVEAVASNGGQIMPPVMGAVAFLMADATSIPYTTICLAALIPAVLYYITLSTSVAAYSHSHKIPVQEKDPNAESIWQVFKSGWFYFLPIVTLIALMVMGYSTQRSALLTIILCFIIGLIVNHKKYTPKNLINLANSAANSMMTVSIACMIAGIIVGSVNITGLGLKLSGIITTLSGGHILIMGILAAIVCIIMGMGLPTAACYIVMAVLVAPAMVDLGVSVVSAHMFVLYYGVVAAITPPVALAVFAAIGISGGDMWKTGFQAIKLAISGFLIPFIFLYNTDLVMFDTVSGTFGLTGAVVLSFVTAALGCMCVAFALFGWFFEDLKMWQRVILVPCGICMMIKNPFILNIVGLAVAIVVLGVAFIGSRSKKKEAVVQ